MPFHSKPPLLRPWSPLLSLSLRTTRALVLGLACAAASAAMAQSETNRCLTSGGHVYLSDKPCPVVANTIQQYGSAPSAGGKSDSRAPAVRLQEVQPHHGFLASAGCKILSEGVRTASARGVGAEGIEGLQKEWQRRCADEDALARQRYQAQLDARRRQQEQARRLAESEAARQQDEHRLRQDHCLEMRRILAKRRARDDLSAGERGDLQRFEANYKERCDA